MASTKVELVEKLKEVLKNETDATKLRQINMIIQNAKQGMYHDFETMIPTPKMELVSHLREAGLVDIANQVISGQYDE